MADLDFKHNVQQIPAGEQLPKPIQRTESIKTVQNPDFQSATSQYASDTNWMSNLGAGIAAHASNAIATKLGSELGKNPQGSINYGMSLTDFDATLQKSYQTQAQSTLGLQASKLISDANIEASKATRITPDLIAKTNKTVSLGLQNIFKHAPDDIKPDMEYRYGHVMIDQSSNLTERMIREQKEDQVNQTSYASEVNSENAYSLAKNGNYKAAEAAVEATKQANESNVALRLTTLENAKTKIDTVRKSYLNGKTIHEYEQAKAEGKGEAFLKNLADNKPKDISDADYISVTNNLMQYINHQDNLRNQDEQLKLAKFNTTLASSLVNGNFSGVTSQLSDLKENVSAIEFEKAQLSYFKALNKFNLQQGSIAEASKSWSDPEGYTRLSDKAKDKSYDVFVNKYMQQQESSGNPVTLAQAEIQVAASAAGRVPRFVNSLNNKAASGNPVAIEEAAQQAYQLREMGAGHALVGLSREADALFTKYDTLRSVGDPVEAAKTATDIVYNQTPEQQQNNKQSWSNYVSKITQGGLVHSDVALGLVGLNKNDFISPSMAHVYGTDILNLYGTYFEMLNGDKDAALKNVKREVEENYGDTQINGGKYKTLHPLEKVLGYEGHDIVPIIQQDIESQLDTHFAANKKYYDEKKTNEYWQVIPKEHHNEALLFGKSYSPIKVEHVRRIGKEEKKESYDVIVNGNAFNQWDISVKSKSGMRPISQVAPYLGVTTYIPNKKFIDSSYLNAQKRKHG